MDRGVWISKDLKWSKQCNTVANKAMSLIQSTRITLITTNIRGDLIETYKILTGKKRLSQINYFRKQQLRN